MLGIVENDENLESGEVCSLAQLFLAGASFRQSRRLAVFPLPKYSPEFNAQERLWHYTRKEGTDNRYFATPTELCASLFSTLKGIQHHREKIHGLLELFL